MLGRTRSSPRSPAFRPGASGRNSRRSPMPNDIPRPEPAGAVHSFQTGAHAGYGWPIVEISRRTDIRQTKQVAVVLLVDRDVDGTALGEKLCEAFDAELTSRPKKAEEGHR